MSTKIKSLLFILFTFSKEILCINVQCISEISAVSDSTDGAVTNVSCSNPNHTLLSCGHRPVDPGTIYFRGSWITEQTCWVQNGDQTQGVYAVARCCDLTSYSILCHTVESELSPAIDDAFANATCSSTEILMGCTVRNENRWNDGSFPFVGHPDSVKVLNIFDDDTITVVQNPNICIGINAVFGGGVRSYATCCKSIKNEFIGIETEAIWSITTNQTSITISCPNTEQFMTSCSGATLWSMINSWEINSNNQCQLSRSVPTTPQYKYKGVIFVYYKYYIMIPEFAMFYIQIALCTNIQTSTPTSNPTPNPTSDPMSQLNTELRRNPTNIESSKRTGTDRIKTILIIIIILVSSVIVIVLIWFCILYFKIHFNKKMTKPQLPRVQSKSAASDIGNTNRNAVMKAPLPPKNKMYDVLSKNDALEQPFENNKNDDGDLELWSRGPMTAGTVTADGADTIGNDEGKCICAECGLRKKGKTYEQNGLFYCDDCLVYYNRVNDDGNGVLTTDH